MNRYDPIRTEIGKRLNAVSDTTYGQVALRCARAVTRLSPSELGVLQQARAAALDYQYRLIATMLISERAQARADIRAAIDVIVLEQALKAAKAQDLVQWRAALRRASS